MIETILSRLKSLTTLATQSYWQSYQLENQFDLSEDIYLEGFDASKLEPISANEKGYLIFPQGRKLAWFHQKITIPDAIEQYVIAGLTARLKLTWWAELAKIFVNGHLLCEGDLFDSSVRLLLAERAQAGSVFEVAIALVSPGHDIGALMKSELSFETNNIERLDPGSIATELTILWRYLAKFAPEKISLVEQILEHVPWDQISNSDHFHEALYALRKQLIPLATEIKQRQFYLLGHAHLDMAWLWTTEETWRVGQRTFNSVLNLQKEFSELVFGHSTPALYEWIETHRPDLWTSILAAVAADRWEILGGMWVEPDVNLVSGESIMRQFLYGQHYFLEKFGKIAPIAWLPDSFGFPQQLPQICQLAGISAFVTGKLHWNESKPFPHGLFNWRSPDGTELLTLMSPPNVTGIMDTDPLTMTDYALKWETQTGLKDIFWLPGVGDHGGGPTRDMLQVAAQWRQSPFFPEIAFSTAQHYLEKVKNTPNLPVWEDELYLELHRGYYTVHRDQKAFNRHCETLLRQLEIWQAILVQGIGSAAITNSPHILKQLWQKVLFNQFHDILPGTSIPEVFEEANQAWQEVIETGEKLLHQCLGAIAQYISYPKPPHSEAEPLLLFNDLNWQRQEIVTLTPANLVDVYDHLGNKILSQTFQELLADGSWQNHLSFQAEVPSVGYALYWLAPNDNALTQREEDLVCEPEFILENEYLRVEINTQTGDIEQIFDKKQQKNVLSGAGNQLQAFADQGQYWDAWDIAPNYEDHPIGNSQLLSIHWREKGKIRSIIRVERRLNLSTFIQDYCLDAHSPLLKIHNHVNWQETQVVVKTAFPLTIEHSTCSYEAPCSTIQRSPTKDPAKWEVPALRWADLNDEQYGVSLLNNSHHGYDAKPNQLRLTLLKSPLWPDPNADRGEHYFSYAIYPHVATWKEAQTVRHARAFNTPLSLYLPSTPHSKNHYPAIHSFLDLGSEQLVLLALKTAEAEETRIILRCYEASGEASELVFSNSLHWTVQHKLDCLENVLETVMNPKEEQYREEISPWKIQTYALGQEKTL